MRSLPSTPQRGPARRSPALKLATPGEPPTAPEQTCLADVLPPGTDVDPGFVVPYGFSIGKKLEAITLNKAGEEIRHTVSPWPLWISAEIAQQEGNLWQIEAVVRGKQRHVVVERSLAYDARKLAQAVSGKGISIAPRSVQYLADYLYRFDSENRLPRKQASAQMGWSSTLKTFLLGSEPLGTEPLVLHSATAEMLAEQFKPKGSLKAWSRAATSMVEASPVAALVLAASVASPMLRLCGWQPIGVVLGSLGGGNKSTLLRLAASVWGSSGDESSRQAAGIVGNGNATMLALLGQFQALADLPHLIDELRVNVTDPRARTDLEAAMHQLIDGVERARMKRDGTGPRARTVAPGCAVIATETDVSEFLTKGGVVRRILPAPSPYATKPLGEHIATLAANHGHVGQVLIRGLVHSSQERREVMASTKDAYAARLRSNLDPITENQRSWSDQVAVALAAVDAATDLVPGLPSQDLWHAQIMACWEQLAVMGSADGDMSSDVVTRAYNETVNWVGTMRSHLRPSPSRARRIYYDGDKVEIRDPVIGRVYTAEDEGNEGEHLGVVDIVQPALRDFLARAGYSIGTMAKEWESRGWIVKHPGRKGYTINAKLGGVQVEVYRITLPCLLEECA